MSEFTGTPGPWCVDETKAFGAYGVYTDYAHPENPGHDGAGYPIPVCFFEPTKQLPTRAERDANARLIAASPDMLAVCVEALANGRHTESCGWWDAKSRRGLFHSDGVCDCWLSRLRAAIAKATAG